MIQLPHLSLLQLLYFWTEQHKGVESNGWLRPLKTSRYERSCKGVRAEIHRFYEFSSPVVETLDTKTGSSLECTVMFDGHNNQDILTDFISFPLLCCKLETLPAEWPSCKPTSSSHRSSSPLASCVYVCLHVRVCFYMCGSVRVKEVHSAWAEQYSGFLCCGVNRPFSPLSGAQRAVIYMEVMEWWRSGWNMCGRMMMRASHLSFFLSVSLIFFLSSRISLTSFSLSRLKSRSLLFFFLHYSSRGCFDCSQIEWIQHLQVNTKSPSSLKLNWER